MHREGQPRQETSILSCVVQWLVETLNKRYVIRKVDRKTLWYVKLINTLCYVKLMKTLDESYDNNFTLVKCTPPNDVFIIEA